MTNSGVDAAWRAVLAAAQQTERLAAAGVPAVFDLVSWDPSAGWRPAVRPDHPAYPLLDLYLPLCNATPARPITVGHLGQSLDGFIATHGGDSQFVTGHENIVHMHRLRALCDAVVVGAGTVAADDPQLTTRHVEGPNPLRVVFDPARRLDARYRVFNDPTVETIYVCARSVVRPGETHLGTASIATVGDEGGAGALAELQRLLFARGCRRIFVEGGGVTVSRFLQANLLDRLQVTVAPFIMGEGRPAIRLPAPAMLSECDRPRHRVFPMGGDVLFELVIREA